MKAILTIGNITLIYFRDFNPKYGYYFVGENAEYHGSNYTRESYSLILSISIYGVLQYLIKNTTEEGVKKGDFIEFLQNLAQNFDLINDFILIFDNARIHRSRDTILFLQRLNIN